MSNESKREYLKTIKEEYRKSNRREKTIILMHAMLVTSLSRKRLIRVLNSKDIDSQPRKRGRVPKYGAEVIEHLKKLWFLMEQPCGKKLKVLIPNLLPSYQKRALGLSPEIEAKLISMSAATIDRFLRQIKVQKGLSTTKAPTSNWYKSAIPVQPKDWNITEPGYAQADTVSHCGGSAAGLFANTLTLTDIDSHWTEMRATLSKQHRGIIRALRDIEKNLPFQLTTIKFDSGTEFMNYKVVSFLRQYGPSYRPKPIKILRSRPYRKNDNCYVEQKNLTHVRQFIGYDRIESEAATGQLNELYKNYWCPFLNFFMPTFKLIRKERIGSRVKKTYETPRTPYERLLASSAISEEKKKELKAIYQNLDPFELKLQIEQKLKAFYETIRTERKATGLINQAA